MPYDADDAHTVCPCPVCGDGSTPVLSRADGERLIFAMTVGMGRHEPEAVGRLLEAATSAHLAARTLALALEGRAVPILIHETGAVFWQLVEQRLSPDEIDRYRSEVGSVSADTSGAGGLLTGVERKRLVLATAAGFGDGPESSQQAQAVLEWAETVRDSIRELEDILNGRLLPYIPNNDDERLIEVREVEELPADQRTTYRRVLAQLKTL